MSTQQDIYAAGSENRPSMLNKENYVSWSSRLLRYAKSRPNGKLIYNSIMNGPYVKRMIPEPGDPGRTVPMMKGSDIGIQEKKAKLFNEWERFTSTDGESIESYYHRFLKLMNDFKRNKHFPEKIATDYTQLYNFLKYNQKEVDELTVKRLAKSQDLLALMANSNNSFKYPVPRPDLPSSRNQVVQNAVQNPGVQNVRNQNGVIVVLDIAHQNGNGNVVAVQDEGNVNGNNCNQIRCYNCRGLGYLARNCTVRPRRRDVAYLQTQLLIAQKEEAGIQLQAEEFDFMAAVEDLDEIKEVNANCILMANLQQASTSGKQITALNEEISNLNKQLSKEKSTVSSLQEEKKRLKSDFKIREDELLDKQIQLENKVKELDNILIKTGQSIQTMHMLSPKPDSFYHTEQKMALGYQNPFYLKQAQQKQQSLYNGKVLLEKHDPPTVYDSEETLELAQESRLKMQLLNKEIKPANYTKINHLLGVFVSQTAKSREELYLSNTFNTANVSKSTSIPNEEFSDDTTPIDARVQNFKIQFLKEAAKFVRDFQSLTNEADEYLAKHKALELEIERLLRAVVSQDIMSIVQNNSVIDTSNLQTELDRTKERFENCIIKKENEYAKLWNDWYKKCEECKYDKISYDKAYNDMQQKIERLQAQLGDQKGKSKDTPCVSDTLDPLFQKLENENVELEFQIRNYEKENAHLKAVYKNLFDSINVTRTQTKTIIDSLQNKLHDTIYENAKLRAQLFDKVSEQKDTTRGTSANTKFAKQSILGIPPSSSRPKLYVVTPLPKSTAIPKVGETNALSNQVTSNSVPSSQELKVMENDNVIAPGMFRIDPRNTSRENKFVPIHNVRASVWTNPITMSQPHVISKKVVNSDSNGFSSTGVDVTTKTRRPQPRSNTKNDRVTYAS
ncbi:hypothetical protein Tco_0746659 [Tanacetum coccineum]